MSDEEKCPCAAVMELKEIVKQHDDLINKGHTNFAVIDTKLNTMIGALAAIGLGILGIVLPMLFGGN